MDAIILAAGYATRLHPLTLDTPKPLLKVAGSPMIEHIIKKLNQINDLSRIYIVTNAKFERHFIEWLRNFDAEKPIEIISDGTTSNENRLGAIGDINFVVDSRKISNDLIVIAGDNLFELQLAGVALHFKKKKSNVIVLHDVRNIDLARQYGIVETKDNIVVNFEEKPVDPKSTLASTGIYFFPRQTLELMGKYTEQGNNPDKMGSFIEWLHKREKIYSFITDKKWYDIGDLSQLERADREYRAK